MRHHGFDGPPDAVPWPLPNVWLGVSVEDQTRADQRVPDLLRTPAAIRFISAEPLLGPVDLQPFLERCHAHKDGDCFAPTCPQIRDGEPVKSRRHCPLDDWGDYGDPLPPRLDWVICGGESGANARPMHPDWARALRDQCAGAGVPFFFKQWGRWQTVYDRDPRRSGLAALPTPSNAPTVMANGSTSRVAPASTTAASSMSCPRDKRMTGRTLDGDIHDAMPGAVAATDSEALSDG